MTDGVTDGWILGIDRHRFRRDLNLFPAPGHAQGYVDADRRASVHHHIVNLFRAHSGGSG